MPCATHVHCPEILRFCTHVNENHEVTSIGDFSFCMIISGLEDTPVVLRLDPYAVKERLAELVEATDMSYGV